MNYLPQVADESKLEYCIRLVKGKVNKIYDIDYTEFFELVFNKQYSHDEARKRFYGIALVLELIDEEETERLKCLEDSEVFRKLEHKRLEIQSERYKLSAIRNDLSKFNRENSRIEVLIEEYINSLNRIEKEKLPNFKPLQVQDPEYKYLLSFSDIHFGKEFVSISNLYSVEEVYKRFELLLAKVISLINKEKINELHVLNLADSIEGMCLRVSQLSALQIGMTDQVIRFQRFIVKWLKALSEYTNIIYHHVPACNHSQIRPHNSKPSDFVKEDMERMLLTYIHDKLEDNNRIYVPEYEDSFIKFNLFDYKIIATHGNAIKKVQNSLKDLSWLHKEFFDYLVMGHLHHSEEITVGEGFTNNNEILITPSIMGSDEYADTLMKGSKGGAKLYCFSKSQGKEITYDIILN